MLDKTKSCERSCSCCKRIVTKDFRSGSSSCNNRALAASVVAAMSKSAATLIASMATARPRLRARIPTIQRTGTALAASKPIAHRLNQPGRREGARGESAENRCLGCRGAALPRTQTWFRRVSHTACIA